MSVLFYRNAFDPFREFDRLASPAATRAQPANDPAYDLVQTGEHDYAITLAVPGYTLADLTITQEGHTLTIKGDVDVEPGQGVTVVRRGIVRGAFARRFALAQHVHVTSATLEDGLLTVTLSREVPEALQPRTIAIAAGSHPAIAQAA